MALLCVVAWPDSYSKSMKAGYLRLLHSLSVVMALVVPMVPSLIQLEVGFQGVGVPALLCLGRDSSYVFYALSLVLSVFSVLPATVVVLVGWAMLKVCVAVTGRKQTLASIGVVAVTLKFTVHVVQPFIKGHRKSG